MGRKVLADEAGVWISEGGRRYGIGWEEIYCVSGYKLDGITEIYTCVTLDFEYGEYFEFDNAECDIPGVIEAITQRLPGIPQDWFDQIHLLQTDDPPLEIWRKQTG